MVSVCKEISKIYEKVFMDNIENLINLFESQNLKGEYVILVAKEGYEI